MNQKLKNESETEKGIRNGKMNQKQKNESETEE